MPEKLYLESKHADIQAYRESDFSFCWKVGSGQCLQVEYIPENWPSVVVRTFPEAELEKLKRTLVKLGFEIQD